MRLFNAGVSKLAKLCIPVLRGRSHERSEIRGLLHRGCVARINSARFLASAAAEELQDAIPTRLKTGGNAGAQCNSRACEQVEHVDLPGQQSVGGGQLGGKRHLVVAVKK